MKQTIVTRAAPAAIGPYSQGIRAGELVFVSGQLPLAPETGTIVPGGIAEQTRQSAENVKAVLEAGGSSIDDTVKTTVYLQDIGDFAAMNEVYAAVFGESVPARAAVEVAALPKGALVEIEAIGAVSGGRRR